jgi:hypothetical protein
MGWATEPATHIGQAAPSARFRRMVMVDTEEKEKQTMHNHTTLVVATIVASSFLISGCAHTNQSQKENPMPINTGEHTVVMRFDVLNGAACPRALTPDDVIAPHQPDFRNPSEADKPADITVETKEDEDGKYSLIRFVPRPACEKWICTRVEIPQVEIPNGADWLEVDVWNDGTPIKIIADATDEKSACFEISFCHNDTTWTGWRTFRVTLRGQIAESRNIDLDREIEPPLRIKYMLILMRQGLPWEIGLRKMTVGLGS